MILVVGAGAVGRGLVGELFSEAGWTVSFLDVDAELVASLNTHRHYGHSTIGASTKNKLVGPVYAGHSTDIGYVATEVAKANCIATAVGARVLPAVIEMLRETLLERLDSGAGPIDILLCENHPNPAELARDALLTGLTPARATYLDDHVGLVATSIGRMIPLPEDRTANSAISTEPYGFLPIDAAALKTGALNCVPRIIRDENVTFNYYTDRKLHVHNMGHFLCGLLGSRRHYTYVWEAIADPAIRYVTRAAMVESAIALAVRYQRPLGLLLDHVDDLLHRFANRGLADPIARVIRDPKRKMAPHDRVFGALSSAVEAGTPNAHLSLAAAAGLYATERSSNEADSSSEDRLSLLPEERIELVSRHLSAFRQGFDLNVQLEILGSQFDPPRIP